MARHRSGSPSPWSATTASCAPPPGTRPSTGPPRGCSRAMERNPGWGAGVLSCSKATNEMNYAAGRFARQVLRTNNIDSCNRT